MKNENFLVQAKKSGDEVKLVFSGQLTINYIQKIKESVGKQIDLSRGINVHVDNPDNLDITFLQLIQSLKITAELNKLPFTVSANLPEELESLVANAGFMDLLNSNPVNK